MSKFCEFYEFKQMKQAMKSKTSNIKSKNKISNLVSYKIS